MTRLAPSQTDALIADARGATRAVPEVRGGAVTLKLMTYNIEYGLRWPAVRDLIAANDADIVCLQEVPQAGFSEPESVHPLEILALLDRPHDFRLLWNRSPKQVGNMTLVRGRIEHQAVLRAPPMQPYGIASVVRVRGVRCVVVNVHLKPLLGPPPLAFALTEPARVKEVVHLCRVMEAEPRPVVAAGDFNSFWPAPACWAMRRRWRDCRASAGGRYPPTRPTYGLPFVIDHVFTRGPITTLDYEVLQGGGSDHRAVRVTLELPRSE